MGKKGKEQTGIARCGELHNFKQKLLEKKHITSKVSDLEK